MREISAEQETTTQSIFPGSTKDNQYYTLKIKIQRRVKIINQSTSKSLTERHLGGVLLGAVLEVEEDALRGLRAQVADVVTDRTDVRLEHEIERNWFRQLSAGRA